MDIDKIKEKLVYYPDTGFFYHRKTGKIAGSTSKYNSGIRYRLLKVHYKQYLAHRVAYALVNGEIPEGLEIDHINRNGLDNRIDNLRLVTRSENQRNKRVNSSKKKALGIVGVYFESDRSKYKAVINVSGKQISLGRYSCLFDACCARKSAEVNF
tara:strand:- start:557 stop:1021 length:465 start_codon:yes stop_codon:yes gene_type:complete